MLNKQWTVRDLELDFLLDLFVVLVCLRHLLLGDSLRHLTGSLQGSLIANQSWRALDTLLETILLDKALNLLLEFVLRCCFLFFHLSSSHSNVSFMLLCGRRYLLIDISVFCADRSALRLQSRVDILVSLIHVLAEIGRWLRLVEFEWLGNRGGFRLLKGLHLCHEFLLNLAEVWYGARPRRLEVK